MTMALIYFSYDDRTRDREREREREISANAR